MSQHLTLFNTLTKLFIKIIFISACSSCGAQTGLERPQTYVYQTQSIPMFFKTLVHVHQKDFHQRDSMGYATLCVQHNLDAKDSSNFEKYYTLYICHQLFTSKTARNGSRGPILNIPYFWHWINPNPRYKIYATANNMLIKDLKPSKDFGNYKSRADIDRTPFLYWSDLFTAKPQYYTVGCDTFSTFGWCSEREMACLNLLETWKYEGKIVAEGNHCWSEYWVNLKTATGSIKYFKVTLDNTFDGFSWELSNLKEKDKWKMALGNLGDTKWYNNMGHSQSEKAKLNQSKASKEAMQCIEQAVIKYLTSSR